MIEPSYALLLGLIQGLTEFIPVSSTAHLRIAALLPGLPDPGAAYSAVIQMGTLLSLLVYFRRDLYAIVMQGREELLHWHSLSHFLQAAALRPLWFIILGTIPISAAGLLLSDWIKGPFRSLEAIAASLIGVALLLWIIERHSSQRLELEKMNWKQALAIGFAQSLALIPGSSRAGTTLAMGLLLGFSRHSALRFSFLLALPAIGLSGLYELTTDWEALYHRGLGGLAVAALTAALSGYLAIAFLFQYLRIHSLLVFIIYRIILGLALLLL